MSGSLGLRLWHQEIEHIKREVAAIEPIRGFAAANSMSDYATHGIHGLYMIYACIGGGVKSVAYQTPDWHVPNGHLTFEYEPKEEGGKTFYGSLQEISGTWGWIRVFGERTFEQFVHSGIHFLGSPATGNAGDVRDPKNARALRGHLREGADVSRRLQIARGMRRCPGGAGRNRRLDSSTAQPRSVPRRFFQIDYERYIAWAY